MLTLNADQVLGRMNLRGIRTKGELAEHLGISRQYVSMLLNGQQQASTDLLLALSQLLGCSIDDIVNYPETVA